MSFTIDEELSQLASEFITIRQSRVRNRFPEEIWKRVINIANKIPIQTVCAAINIQVAYLRKKMSDFDSLECKEPLTFLEIPKNSSNLVGTITINIETSCGNKLKIEGATTSCIGSLIHEFLKGGSSCYK